MKEETAPRLLNEDERERFFQALLKAIPEPQTELVYTNSYTLLVAVVLSAQATDKGVNKATDRLFQRAHTPAQMVALGEEGLRAFIASLNLYKTKAKHIIALSQLLLRDHKGEVPESREALEKLPGVGRKTASVVLNVAFHHPTIPVDTHVFRVANRTGLALGKTPLVVEKKLEERVPQVFLSQAHHLLILHGRYTCKAVKPLCPLCVVREICLWPGKVRSRAVARAD